MSLRINSLRLHNFRNYTDFTLQNLGDVTVLVGPNAVGKTNIIEALQLLTALDSFRTPKAEQLIRWGRSQASAQATFTDGQRQLEMRLVLDERGKHHLMNGKQRPRAELQGVLPSVLFTPDDLQLVKGSPEGRRRALDTLGMQVSRNYLSVKRDYEKLLRQKNRLLKEDVTPGYLASINEVMARIGSQLICYRLRIVREMQEIFPALYGETTATRDEAGYSYIPSVLPSSVEGSEPHAITPDEIEAYLASRSRVEEDYIRLLETHAAEETARHTSLVGPHRDKPLFTLNDRSAQDFASQGQQRSLVITYKLAELQIIEKLVHQKPILLLDDVMSELDASRRETLTTYISRSVQSFITTTNLDYFTPEFREGATIISLGRV